MDYYYYYYYSASVDEIHKFDHLNESFEAILSSGTVY